MGEIERRFITVEMRASEGEEMIIEGYPIVYDQETDIGWFREKIAQGAATNALARSDEFVLFNHNADIPLARRANGTLTATEDDRGVFIRADLSKSDRGPGIYRDVKSGLINKMSFAFTVARQTWIEEKDQKDLRVVDEFEQLYDYSPVTYPAYQQTSVQARSAETIFQDHKSTTVEERAGSPETEEQLDLLKRKAELTIRG